MTPLACRELVETGHQQFTCTDCGRVVDRAPNKPVAHHQAPGDAGACPKCGQGAGESTPEAREFAEALAKFVGRTWVETPC